MKLLFVGLVVILFIGCAQPAEDTPIGIKISSAEYNEDREIVHNIFNFDDELHVVKVTTLCFGDNQEIINDEDSYVMNLTPNSVSGWKPKCPENTKNYRIDLENVTVSE